MAGTGLNQISGTQNYNPSIGEVTLYAFSRCGIRRTALVAEHLADARTASNMILSDWANDQPNLWTVDLQTIQCVEGQAQYDVPGTTILMLDAFLRMNAGQSNQADFFMYPISRTEWAAFPDKTTPGRPTVYWFDRLIAPNVTIWQPPSDPSWQFLYYRVQQIDDAELSNAGTLQIPYYFLKAFADRLSAELAVMYAPERAIALHQAAEISWKKARDRNAESVPLYITPGMRAYYPGS